MGNRIRHIMHFLKRLVRSPKETISHTGYSCDDEGLGHGNNNNDHRRNDRSSGGYSSSGASSYSDLSRSPTSRVPEDVLVTIFSFVCPHALDESYSSAEESTTELGCMLCDMRELSRCGLVCRSWHEAAQLLQYRSIRLDSVHYCGLEEELQARQKRGSFFQKQTSPRQVLEHRMRLLYRTFQENETAATLTRFLKMPYMTRETCKQDLARLVSLLPNLRYVDLPDGVFQDDPSCVSLKAILYTRCPDLQKMSWVGGSEKNFVDLWIEPPWLGLKVVELTEMVVENRDLVRVLSSMPYLIKLKLKSMPWTSDAIFDSATTDVGSFPALEALTIEDTPGITIPGLATYLVRPIAAETLEELTIINTGSTTAGPAHPLHLILSLATRLTSLTLRTHVSCTIPHPGTPLLTSATLTKLAYEIIDDANSPAKSLAQPSPSYYAYLSESLWHNAFPRLKNLHVREPTFHTRLLNDKCSATRSWTQGCFYLHASGAHEPGGDGGQCDEFHIGGANDNVLVVQMHQRSPGVAGFSGDFGGLGGNSCSALQIETEYAGRKERRKNRTDLWR